jgi:hypothetical protein
VTIPFNFYLNNRWLESFAYDAPFNAMNYIGTIVLANVLAIVTVSYHIYIIRKSDPVEALR